ncbi:MAG: DUF748 domain-containing protein [Planctomycetota bacterium]|nr:MAG: DUF748 domain-containing protein [Planctomycetota bacterium]
MHNPEEQSEEAHHLAPAPRPRRLWPWILGVVLIIITLIPIGILLLLEMGFSWLARQAMHDFALEHEMVIEGKHEVSASLLGSSITINDTGLRDAGRGDARPFMGFASLDIDTSLWAALRGRDLVIDHVELQAPYLDLRRREDGSIPGIPDELQAHWQHDDPPPALIMLAGALDMARGILLEQPQGRSGEDAHVVHLRRLLVQNGSIHFPDPLVAIDNNGDTTCAFSLQGVTIEASDLSSHPQPQQTQSLRISLDTAAAGSGQLSLQHSPLNGGAFTLSWTDVPLQHIAHPTMSGDLLSAYNPQGSGNLRWQLAWDGAGRLEGQLTVSLYDLRIHPADSSDRQLQQLAVLMRQDDSLFTWEVPFSGSLSEPLAPQLSWEHFLERLRQHYLEGPDDML